MANEPYMSERFMGCFKAPARTPRLECDPKCSVDHYTQAFRDRWKLISQDPCSKIQFTALNDACCNLGCSLKSCENICLNPGSWGKGKSLYDKSFELPKSHNIIDDCCPPDCHCADQLPDYCRDSKNVAYAPTQPWTTPSPPMSDCTTYNTYYHPHVVEPRWQRPRETYDPCECPLEQCSTTKIDYTRKTPIPNGPANSEVIKHGLWSVDQFCKPFDDVTSSELDYPPKCTKRPPAVRPCHNLWMPSYYPLKSDTETATEFTCKSEDAEPVHCYHTWLDNENWHKPETPLDKCTTYNHYYRPFSFPPGMKCEVESPGAIPFCSMNRLCYSCTDPVPNQKPPVELKDNDPWPYVKECAIRYQDNLQRDPCAPFRDDTTYKTGYYAKALCRPRFNFAPLNRYFAPITPINDDTTMKVSYPAHSECQYKEAKTYSGNPCGIRWGLNNCPDAKNRCLPRFPAPFGHPLKPYNRQHCRCPCGPFDSRSTYNQAFHFRDRAQLEEEREDMCRQVNVPEGVSLYRFDYVHQHGKQAARMPPPISKGHRCMHPCSIRDLDSLNRVSYLDFWKTVKPDEMEDLYRAKPFIKTRRSKPCPPNDGCEGAFGEDGSEPILYQPIIIKRPPKSTKRPCPSPCSPPQPPSCPPDLLELGPEEMNVRCKPIPYSGKNIRNLAKGSLVCDGHDGQ